jgi:hypothetical protein
VYHKWIINVIPDQFIRHAAFNKKFIGISIRQIHDWLSIAFTLTVIANFVAIGLGRPPAWMI